MLPIQANPLDIRPPIVQRCTCNAIAVPIDTPLRKVNVEDGLLRVFARRFDQDECAAVRARTADPAAAESAEFAGDGYLFVYLCECAAYTWCAVSNDVSG
mmetsp:Transcript_13837/g.30763  ORF Transcript_13837/g.30763 Transcript_13837/m.30763 type:complete len:100 (+) Transcript_13837:567-866(+)